jgi:predicted transcriptional regulator
MVEIEKLIELNFKGLTQREMAKELNVSRATVQRTLKKLCISTPNHHNSLKFDNTVFDSIDTEEKAYWLGFLYADGNVSSTINNVEVSLSISDIDHLEKYRMFLKNESPVKIGEVSCNGKIFKRCRLSVVNKYFKERLIELGCIPNKSLKLRFPHGIFENSSLKYHFIRGYVDGDGSISFTKTGRLVLNVVGTKEFLLELLKIFPEFPKLEKDSRRKHNTYYIRCCANAADKVLTKLYKDSNIYLQRKYDRVAVLSSNW